MKDKITKIHNVEDFLIAYEDTFKKSIIEQIGDGTQKATVTNENTRFVDGKETQIRSAYIALQNPQGIMETWRKQKAIDGEVINEQPPGYRIRMIKPTF
ncbi:MAG: hypothetical protein ISS23_01785 [Nanoarchaeota archaeon]|nr:hypothetical protein [Nanoarchaeota archaeon]